MFRIPIPLAMLAGSAVPLTAALIAQYGFGLYPCELCLWQRWPYLAIVLLGLVALFVRRQARWLKRLLALAVLGWLAAAGLAFYHVGVEQGWWAAAGGCAAAPGTGQDLDAVRAAILNAPLVACDQPEFVLLGLSMAGWNTGFALLFALYGVVALQKRGANAAARR